MVSVFAWLRRKYTDSFPIYQHEIDKIRERWKNYDDMRRELYETAHKYEPLPYWDGGKLKDNDWVCPIDDDDIHAPYVDKLLREIDSDVDCVWWDTASIRWVKPVFYTPLTTWFGRNVPNTCGYAYRYRLIKDLSQGMKDLLRDDHVHIVTHVVGLGKQVRYVNIIGGLYNVTPASLTMWREFKGPPPWPTEEEINLISLDKLPPWCVDFVQDVIGILRKYRGSYEL